MDVTISENVTTATVSGTSIAVTISENVQTVTLTYPGIQGAPGSDGIVTVNSPLTNTGTFSSAVLGIDQTLLSLTRTQIVGTAVTLNYGTALAAGTATYATTAGSATNAGSALTAGTASYASTAGSEIGRAHV